MPEGSQPQPPPDPLRTQAQREQWEAELLDRVQGAPSAADRAQALRRLDRSHTLSEATARALYRIDADVSRDFILHHLPRVRAADRALWAGLLEDAARRGDETFYYLLYRRQVPRARWQKDIAALALRVRDPAQLCTELERCHPQGRGLDLGPSLYELTADRGEDVLPYVQRHLRSAWSRRRRGGFEPMLALARTRGWWGMWAALVSACARPAEYSREVANLLRDAALPDSEARHRLRSLADLSHHGNASRAGPAPARRFDESVALAVYERFPDLLRGPLRENVAPAPGRSFGALLRKAIDLRDEELIDFLAAHLACRGGVYSDGPRAKAAREAAQYYESLQLDGQAFARRVAGVLTQLPAASIRNRRDLLRSNHLARLLFERSPVSYLASPEALGDLLEADEVHVQALAYQALALDDERARRLAQENLDVLLAGLLRPLPRAIRALALATLRNASDTPEAGARVAARAREALDLPGGPDPNDALIGLLGTLLHRFPRLRQRAEKPVVHRRAA